MTDARVYRAVSADGTEIVGRVHGRGPPLVLVHSAAHDGDMAWEAMLRHLTDRFTCYLPSIRGVGLSGDNPDHSPPRLEEDVISFVDSIGEPVRLVGFSTGGPLVLGAATHSGAVAAVAVYDLLVGSVMREEDLAGWAPCWSRWVRRLPTAGSSTRLVPVTASRPPTTSSPHWRQITWTVPTSSGAQASFRRRCSGSSRAQPMRDPGLLILRCSHRSPRRSWFYGVRRLPLGWTQSSPILSSISPGTLPTCTSVNHCRAWGTTRPLLALEPIAKELITFFESVRQFT